MHISELARASGLSVDTLRFYEKQHLLDAHHFDRLANNYRSYTPAAIDRLEMIKCAKLFGFTLSEIKSLLLDLSTHDLSTEQQADILAQKQTEIDARITDILRLKTLVSKKIASLRNGSTEVCKLPPKVTTQSA